MLDFDLLVSLLLKPHLGQHLLFDSHHLIPQQLHPIMETSFIRLIWTTEKHQPVTPVNRCHQNQTIVLNASPSQDLDHGECSPLKQLISHPGPPNIDHKALEMIHLDLKISRTNPKEQTTKGVI